MAIASLATSTQLVSSAPPRLSQAHAALKPSRPHRIKSVARGTVGAALLATCLQAGAASALSFNFSFTGTGFPASPATVTGTVEGLVDNLSNQISGVTVTVTGATNSGSLPAVFTDANSSIGDGFDVSGGQVTGVDISYYNFLTDLTFSLANNNQNGSRNEYTDLSSFGNEEADGSPTNSLRFTPINPPSAPVPGPLPLFGAAATFGWSRQLRRRIKTSV